MPAGLPIQAPVAQTNLNSLLLRQCTGANCTYANRVPGQPLFLRKIELPLLRSEQGIRAEPERVDQSGGRPFGTGAAYYSDYRCQRQPQENLALGRRFRIGERGWKFNIRADSRTSLIARGCRTRHRRMPRRRRRPAVEKRRPASDLLIRPSRHRLRHRDRDRLSLDLRSKEVSREQGLPLVPLDSPNVVLLARGA